MKKAIFYTIILFFSSQSFHWANSQTPEVIDDIVNGRYQGLIKVTSIDSENNSISLSESLNIKTILYNNLTSVSGDGQVIVNKDRIIHKNGEIIINDIPSEIKLNQNNQTLNYDGTRVVFTDANEGGCYIYVHNTVDNSSAKVRISDFKIYTVSGLSINRDASIIAVIYTDGLYVVDLNNDTINKYREGYGYHIVPFVNSSGSRILFNTGGEIFYMDKENGEWQPIKNIELGNAIVGGYDVNSYIYDIANDGKTIVAPIGNKGVAVVNEIDGVWGEPDYIGYIPDTQDKVQISENGKVVAVQAYKYTSVYNFFYYDAYIFIKNVDNQWIKHQVNAHDQDVNPDIHLTKDGTQLIWTAADFGSSIPSAGLHR